MSFGGRDGYDSDEAKDLDELKSDLTSSAESVEKELVGATFSSAPSSPKRTARKPDTEFCLLSVKQRISSLENLADRSSVPSTKMSLDSQLSGFIKSRAAYKGKITFLLNGLKVISDKGELNEPMLRQQANAVNKYLEKIEDIEMQMADVWESNSVNLDDSKRNEDI